MNISLAPPILIIQFKRFEGDSKIYTPVKYSSDLDLTV